MTHEQSLRAAKMAFFREMDPGLGVESAISSYLTAMGCGSVEKLKQERDDLEAIRVGMASDWFEFCEAMEVQPDTQEAVAYHLKATISNLTGQLAEARDALKAARKRMLNSSRAIESNQVVDKDVHGTLTRGIREIDAALSSKESSNADH